jgi:hypothetical protein
MIRARLTDGTFLLGVDAENLRRLTAGQTLVVDLSGMGGHDTFIMLYGETMADIMAELETLQGGPLPPAQPFGEGNA